MKIRIALLTLLIAGFTATAVILPVYSQDLDNPLPRSLTDGERKLIESDFGGYLRNLYGPIDRLGPMRKPEGEFRAAAEFEKCEGICFGWAGYTGLLKQLISEASQGVKVFLAISDYNTDQAISSLVSAGAKKENLIPVKTSIDSVWMRDYGPYFIYNTSGGREIIDCLYNRPRPNDDKFPSTLGRQIGVKAHPCRLIMPGGNFMTDGCGVAIMTDVVFDPSQGGDPNMSVEDLNTYMRDFFGIKRTIILRDLARDGTGHVDIFAKLLDRRNVIVGQYAKPGDGYGNNQEIMDEAARRLSEETNGLGEKFIVHRIPMPPYTYGTTFTHTNSTIVNDKVLVPTYGKGTDEGALAVYRKVLPDHKVIGYDCNDIITANGAIHCITKLVMTEPVRILHTRTRSVASAADGAFIKFNVDTSKPIHACRVLVHWASDPEGPFAQETAERVGETGGLFSYTIPSEKGTAYYFISVETPDGIVVTNPKTAPEELHSISIN